MRLNATRPVNAGLTGGLPVEEELPRSSSSRELVMPSCPVTPPDVTPGREEDAALELLGQAGMVAVRGAGPGCAARQGGAGGGHGRPAGAARSRGGEDRSRGAGGVLQAGGGGPGGGAPRRAGAGRRAS